MIANSASAANPASLGPSLGSAGHVPVAGKSCGDVPAGPVKDPDHVVSGLPPLQRSFYQGLPYTVLPSAYSHWKPKHGPPWTIGFLDGPLQQPENASLMSDYQYWAKQLEAEGLVKTLIARAAPDYTVATQLQQFNSMIEQHPDLIMVEPNSNTALIPAIQRAYKADIPTVTISGIVQSPDALNWSNNPWLNGAVPTAYLADNYVHDKGNFLVVEGAPTQPTSIAGLAGAEAALKNCPNIHIVNPAPLNSQYSNSVAKSVVLQFLASYHGAINGVYDGGVVSTGIISAFRQLGMHVPPTTNLGMVVGGLTYWYQHPSTFGGPATGSGGYEYNRIPMDMAVRVLEGKGPKLNTIVAEGLLVTPKNLDQLAQYNKSTLNINNINIGEVPPFAMMSSSELNGYFAKPGLTGPAGLDKGQARGRLPL
jgi:ribose transport system substrate-binding protein